MQSRLVVGDALEILRDLPSGSVQTCVTSPPYFGLRDYGSSDQIGAEDHPDDYVRNLTSVMGEVRRVLRDDGTLWLVLGDSYAGGKRGRGDTFDGYLRAGRSPAGSPKSRPVPKGYKRKDLLGIPWMVAFSLRDSGWYLRSDIIWSKPNPMPDSAKDRPTRSHEYVFLFSKEVIYKYDASSIREDGRGEKSRNRRSVWTVTPRPYKGAHFGTFPPQLAELCILAGSHQGDVVLDPFVGSGTTAMVAHRLGRHYIGIDINEGYIEMAEGRVSSGK